jgi:4-hydroxybenzoate polyprenyltransferase
MLFEKVLAHILILRPENILAFFVLAALSTITTDFGNSDVIWRAPLAGLGIVFVAGASFVMNDVFDVEANKINNPERVIVQGRMSRRWAFWYSIVLLLLSFLVFYHVGTTSLIVGFFIAATLFVYSYKLRQIHGLTSNITIAVVVGVTYAFGAAVTGTIDEVLITLFVFGFLMSAAREMSNDIADEPGDVDAGFHTLPMKIGVPKTFRYSAGCLIALLFFSYAVLGLGLFNEIYGLLVTLLNVPLVYCILVTMKEGRVPFVEKVLKGGDISVAGKILKILAFAYPLIPNLCIFACN